MWDDSGFFPPEKNVIIEIIFLTEVLVPGFLWAISIL